jgi:hypothetical protein
MLVLALRYNQHYMISRKTFEIYIGVEKWAVSASVPPNFRAMLARVLVLTEKPSFALFNKYRLAEKPDFSS